MRQGTNGGRETATRDWRLDASHDGRRWFGLLEHKDDTSLHPPNSIAQPTHTWAVPQRERGRVAWRVGRLRDEHRSVAELESDLAEPAETASATTAFRFFRVMNQSRGSTILHPKSEQLGCAGLELYGTVSPWTAATHSQHASPRLRALIKVVLMVDQRCRNRRDAGASDESGAPSLPKEIWWLIFSWVSVQMLAF